MDGNGRWAKKRGLPRTEGHRKGMKVVKETIKSAQELGVRYLTLYAFSTENWKRSKEEVDFLMNMCQEMISKELTFMIKNDIRLLHIGRKDGLSDSLQSCIHNAEKLTENNRRFLFSSHLTTARAWRFWMRYNKSRKRYLQGNCL